MTKESKIILFIISILIIIYAIVIEIYCNKVHALEMDPYYISAQVLNNNTLTQTLDTNNKDFIFNFETNQTINNYGYDYITGNISVQILNTNITTDLSNIDFETTCTHQQNYGGTSNLVGTITYADNTQSDVYISYIQKLCNEWSTNSANNTAITENVDNHPFIAMRLQRSNGLYILCDVNTNGYFTCYNDNRNEPINSIRITISKVTPTTHNAVVSINRAITRIKDPSNSVSNAINNQSTQQHQDWNNFNNSDIGQDAKTPPNTTNADNVAQQEEQIYDTIKQDPSWLQTLTIDLDPDTNTWIWNTFNAIANTHRYIIILITSVLTIGLAKQVLGR